MKAAEVQKLSDEELTTEAARLRKEIFKSKAQAVTQKLEKPSLLGEMRHDIARVLTELRSRQLKKQKA